MMASKDDCYLNFLGILQGLEQSSRLYLISSASLSLSLSLSLGNSWRMKLTCPDLRESSRGVPFSVPCAIKVLRKLPAGTPGKSDVGKSKERYEGRTNKECIAFNIVWRSSRLYTLKFSQIHTDHSVNLCSLWKPVSLASWMISQFGLCKAKTLIKYMLRLLLRF